MKEFGEIIEKASPNSRPEFEEFGELITDFSSPSFISEVGRHTLRTGSRIAESVLGLPSDVLQAGQLGARQLEKMAGKLREKIGLSPLKSGIKKPGLPGSDDLRELSTRIFGEKVLPQSETESFIDNIVADAAVLAIPIKGKIPFLRSLGTALAGNLASKGAEKAGIGEKGQAAAKMGAFFLSGLSGKGTVKKYWNEQYKLAEESIPSKARMDAKKLERDLDILAFNLKKGGIETPSQRFVEKPLKELKKIIHNGKIGVEDAVKAKQKINELRSGLFDEVKGRPGQKYARTKINDISHFLDESLDKYGKNNPKFYKHYKSANEAYGGYQQSKRVGDWISRAIPGGKMGKGSLILLEAIFKPTSLKKTLPAVAAFTGGELLTRMFKNPTLRRFYGNLMKDAINENKTGFLKNLKYIEREIEKTDPEVFGKNSQSS